MQANCQTIRSNGWQVPRLKGDLQTKYIDSQIPGTSVTSTGTIVDLTNIAQGVVVSDRVGDTINLRKFTVNYNVSTQNADIFNSVRILFFQWKPNTSLVAPTVADILENVGAFATLSPYAWHFSSQYRVIYDRVHWMSGLATVPTIAGLQGHYGEIPKSYAKTLEFAPASVNGSNKVYVLSISDSAVLPFPILNLVCRTEFAED
jgi:hypothetical protein